MGIGIEALALGTARVAMIGYGHSSGPADDPGAVLDAAFEAGLRKFDTSPRYESAEELLGKAIARSGIRPWVSSKIDGLSPGDRRSSAAMRESVLRSLQRLGIDRLDLCYLHQNRLEILRDDAVAEGLRALKAEGLVRAVGASVYSHEEASFAAGPGLFDFVQVPVNLLDASFHREHVHGAPGAVKFAARSLLLQGILVNRERLPRLHERSGEIMDFVSRLDALAGAEGLSARELALAFAFSLKGFDHYIIGTASVKNLLSNIACTKIVLPPDILAEVSALAAPRKEWSNPRTWRTP